jgi:Flp pilus assembly pilin Flp
VIPQNRKYWWTLWLPSLLAPRDIWRALKCRLNSGWAGLIQPESGASMAEYAILVCGIALAILVLLQQVGNAINQVYLYVISTLTMVH